MASAVRRTPPKYIRYFLNALQCLNEVPTKTLKQQTSSSETDRPDSIAIDALIKILMKETNCENGAASEIITNAVSDGMLVLKNNNKFVRLPTIAEIPSGTQRDLYCFECHQPGSLEHCAQCNRSFHVKCYRKNPERPIYALPSSKQQKNRLPTFSPDSQTDTDDDNMTNDYYRDTDGNSELASNSLNTHNPPNQMNNISVTDSINNPNAANAIENKPSLDDISKQDSKLDVICLGEIRSPNRMSRKRRTAAAVAAINGSPLYKNEHSLPTSDEVENELNLCTCCRLLKSADIRNPPHIQPDELCYLINFIYLRNRSWVINDIVSYLNNLKISSEAVRLITQTLLFKELVRFDEIDKKIQEHKYTLLMEFLIDLLDMQHQIGVFFGSESMEMEATKWMLRYVTHDLSEIRRCADCFRYSHEKNSIMWFAKPCVQRHELVYAKHGNFPYWPAKVVRVLYNDKYDVRFFGGSHSRALIDASNIRPIDSEMPALQMHKSPGLRKAFVELQFHKLLSAYPSEKFSFHADPQEIEFILNTVHNMTMSFGLMQKRRTNKQLFAKEISNINSSCSMINGMSQHNTNNTINGRTTTILEDNNNNNINAEKTICHPVMKANSRNQITNVKVLLNRLNSRYSLKHQQQQQQQQQQQEQQQQQHQEQQMPQQSTCNSEGTSKANLLNDLDKIEDITKFVKIQIRLLMEENRKLRKANKLLELDKKKIKRKIWCIVCLKEAAYICCLKAAYCSKKCKILHWNNGHKLMCKNKSKKGRKQIKR